MEKIIDDVQNLLCKLLQEGGEQILNYKEECLEDKLDTYQELIENAKKIDIILGEMVRTIEYYD